MRVSGQRSEKIKKRDSVEIIRSFPPIATPAARILILGSMPGEASLQAKQYYAHPMNAFWRIMGDLFGVGPGVPYEERTSVLQSKGVAIWDVLEACTRPGSLDHNIRDEAPNDFAAFFAEHPHLTCIGLNGGKAAASFKKHAARFCPAHVHVTQLPSTSPAHAARGYAEKLALWREGLGLE